MARISRKLDMIKLTAKQIADMIAYMKRQDDISALFLYGSYGTEYQTLFSDVDFAILPSPSKLDFGRELYLLAELQHIGQNDDINLVNLLQMPVTLQMRILETGQLLYCRNEILLADFTEQVIRRHSDFEPDLRVFYQDYDAGLREELL